MLITYNLLLSCYGLSYYGIMLTRESGVANIWANGTGLNLAVTRKDVYQLFC